MSHLLRYYAMNFLQIQVNFNIEIYFINAENQKRERCNMYCLMTKKIIDLIKCIYRSVPATP